ncbi:hypothetical protein M514_03386 [Trichuris suis]|uniref:Uncharacterized protein n=1 Tax=Trichuris suis TaxID=68888 RepID=A0A085NF04_9BILA|nr:hypothetical protein M513_03386 [Trichuris suis]KFD68050.1 hypothetical protein M514_03386 [Trichuris suis]
MKSDKYSNGAEEINRPVETIARKYIMSGIRHLLVSDTIFGKEKRTASSDGEFLKCINNRKADGSHQ